MAQILFFIEYIGGLYAAGRKERGDGTVPGGPLGYVLRQDAETVAETIGGRVVIRLVRDVVEFCLQTGFVLWIKQAGGGLAYVVETVPQSPSPKLERVVGAAQRAAIEAAALPAGKE